VQKLGLEIVPRLRRRIVDSYLKHGKPALQLDRTVLGALLRSEFGLQGDHQFLERILTLAVGSNDRAFGIHD
jgi:hypothetical protein